MAVETAAPNDEELVGILLDQAKTLDDRAERLREDAKRLAREAAELRTEAATIDRPSVGFVDPPYHVSSDQRLRRRLLELLGKHGASTSAHVADHLSVPQARVRTLLRLLEEQGDVKRGGLKRGTVWALSSDEGFEAVRMTADARTQIRDAVRKLDTFTFPELCAELPFSEVTVRRWLVTLVREGMVTEERVGTAKLYAHEKPTGPNPARPKHEPPETKVIEHARRTSGPISGTGRAQRAAGGVVNELLRELRANHPQVEIKRRSHKFAFYFDGREISSCSLTPGASALGETRRLLRHAGVMVGA